MWMGGTVPLGYGCSERKLVVDEGEAATVQRIYADYLALGAVRPLHDRLRAEGVVGKSGRPLGRGALFHMLGNRVYRGEVTHKGASIPASTPPSWPRSCGARPAARSARAGRGGEGKGSG
jgi:hypothetical protein